MCPILANRRYGGVSKFLSACTAGADTICLPTHPYWLATNPLHKIKTYIMEGEIMRTTSTPGKQAGFWHRLKNSTMQTPWHILRQLALLAPLGTLCLPMFYAGHKNVSLITIILCLSNHGADLRPMITDKGYGFAVATVFCALVLGIAELICSLFTAAKGGDRRNMTAFGINAAVFALTAFLAIGFGARAKVGLAVTFGIYLLQFLLHTKVSGKKIRPAAAGVTALLAVPIVLSLCFLYKAQPAQYTTPGSETDDVRTVTFNVASVFGNRFDDTDSMTRCARFAAYMNQCKPDLIGTQEMNIYWYKALQTTLPDYDAYGVQRGGDATDWNSEMNPVFWNKTKYTALEKNTFWLSETPNKASRYTYTDENGQPGQAGCYRICSYVVLQDRTTGKRLLFLNTHLDNASQQAADFGAEVIIEHLTALQAKYGKEAGVVLTGDFNETQEDEAYRRIAARLQDCTDPAKKTTTYQEWGYCDTGNEPIDFIFTSGTGSDYTVLNDLSGGYVSDHYGVYANIRL